MADTLSLASVLSPDEVRALLFSAIRGHLESQDDDHAIAEASISALRKLCHVAGYSLPRDPFDCIEIIARNVTLVASR